MILICNGWWIVFVTSSGVTNKNTYHFKSSRCLMALILFFYGLALICTVCNNLHTWLRLLLSAWVIRCAWYSLRMHAWGSHPLAISSLTCEANYFMIIQTNGCSIIVQLDRRSCCWSKCLILNFQSLIDEKKYNLILMPDSMQLYDFRTFRSYLLVKLQI